MPQVAGIVHKGRRAVGPPGTARGQISTSRLAWAHPTANYGPIRADGHVTRRVPTAGFITHDTAHDRSVRVGHKNDYPFIKQPVDACATRVSAAAFGDQ
jgi:hypothetical protein